MMVFSAQIAKGVGACPAHPFHSIYPLHLSYEATATPYSAKLAR